eukprot:scaffold2986_cov222-Alexandrium_tamarense.AAC.1
MAKVVSASTIVEAVKKESGREKREGQGRFLGAFSKADSLRETLLERKNKKPRKVRHWKPNEVEEADFNSSTALGRLGIEPSHTKVESFAADISGGIPCTKRNGKDDVKCNGGGACYGINPDHVGCGSCNGEAACMYATGTVIGEESCNEYGACYKTSGAEIEDQSCNGRSACGLSPGVVVEKGSCNTSYELDYYGAMCALAPGAHIGKESCLGHYGEDPKLAKVVVRALYPVMLAFIMEETTLLLMVQGATLAMDLAIMTVVVIPFAALLATTPAIVLLPAFMVREQFMMVPVVAPTAVITLHAMLWPAQCLTTHAMDSLRVMARMVELAWKAAMSMKRVTIRLARRYRLRCRLSPPKSGVNDLPNYLSNPAVKVPSTWRDDGLASNSVSKIPSRTELRGSNVHLNLTPQEATPNKRYQEPFLSLIEKSCTVRGKQCGDTLSL